MTPIDEKTDKERKTGETTNPLGMETKHGLAKLEVAQVEIVEPSVPEKKLPEQKSVEAKTKPDVAPKASGYLPTEVKPVYDGMTRASGSYDTGLPEQSWSAKIKKAFIKSGEIAADQIRVFKKTFSGLWEQHLSKLFQSEDSETSELKSFFEFLGPTILVSTMFFVWVIYDRSTRVYVGTKEAQADRLTIEALEEVSKGRTKQAQELLTNAIKITNNPEQAKKLQTILEQLK